MDTKKPALIARELAREASQEAEQLSRQHGSLSRKDLHDVLHTLAKVARSVSTLADYVAQLEDLEEKRKKQ